MQHNNQDKSLQKKERILKLSRKRGQLSYNDRVIRITEFSTETLKSRRHWPDILQPLETNEANLKYYNQQSSQSI